MPRIIQTVSEARVADILAAIPGFDAMHEEATEVAALCAWWRARSEEHCGWAPSNRAFSGRCCDESEDLRDYLNHQMLLLDSEFRVGETNYLCADGAKCWHVVLGFDFRGERWIADVTADQFGGDIPPLVFGRLADLPQYQAVPSRDRSPLDYDHWFPLPNSRAKRLAA